MYEINQRARGGCICSQTFSSNIQLGAFIKMLEADQVSHSVLVSTEDAVSGEILVLLVGSCPHLFPGSPLDRDFLC